MWTVFVEVWNGWRERLGLLTWITIVHSSIVLEMHSTTSILSKNYFINVLLRFDSSIRVYFHNVFIQKIRSWQIDVNTIDIHILEKLTKPLSILNRTGFSRAPKFCTEDFILENYRSNFGIWCIKWNLSFKYERKCFTRVRLKYWPMITQLIRKIVFGKYFLIKL